MIKYIFDKFFSLLLIILFLPLFICISILLLANDGFPILFRQKRVGMNNKDFILYKFRTMRTSKMINTIDFKPHSRVTKFGSLLRRTKLDEFPQLYNILIGDLSFVGPRPEVREWVDKFYDKYKKILHVKPGLTDLASIKYRNEERILRESSDPIKLYEQKILPDKLRMNEEYVKNRNFFLDIKILLLTLRSVIKFL